MIDNRKFSKVLTAVLIIIGIAILVTLGFVGYDMLQSYYINKGANEAVDALDKELNKVIEEKNDSQNNLSQNDASVEQSNETVENDGGSSKPNSSSSTSENKSQSTKKNTIALKYKGFDVVGKIEIPKTHINYPVLSKATISSMEVSVGVTYGPGLNEVGNTVIMGHNYRNNALFSKNSKLEIGDVIYITDLSGERVRYIAYNIYTTSADDFEYASRDTAGKREISLSTCTDDVSARTVIWAKEAE